ncbi:tartrate-resistant acid phosphatase type 5-like isoform X2 [Acanthaster planci]|nr:tartrate-resistant acid phosphatase type 5-like isoform X2 [Acanthaster planci]
MTQKIFLVLVLVFKLVDGVYLPQSEDGILSFLALGDWGGVSFTPYTTPDELGCANQMGAIAKRINSTFVLALGDNFYDFGIRTDAHDKRFKETFEDVFTAQSLQTPWYIIAGNHDWRGNVTAELEYTKLSKRWTFPSLYYAFNHTIPGTKVKVAFIMLDTQVLCSILDEFSTPEELAGPLDKIAAEKEWQWVEEQLKATQSADYVIVAGHYPVWSIAEHGPTDCLVSRLRPLLIKYNVSAYFSGHDHNLQHLREDNLTVDYFVIGAGHIIDTSESHKDSVPHNSLKFHYADIAGKGGFAYVQTTPKSMRLIFSDGLAGKDLYSAEIRPRSKVTRLN